MVINNEFNNSSYILKFKLYCFKIKQRRDIYKRYRGKHLDNLFISRKKRFSNYYQLFDSKLTKKNLGCKFNSLHENSFKKKFKLGLKSVEYDLITAKSLKSLKYCNQRFTRSRRTRKNFIKGELTAFPSYWLTAKPKSVRMGKGKGALTTRIDFLNKGEDIYNFKLLKYFIEYKIKKKMYFLKTCLIIFFLLKILKTKTSTKNLIYKKVY